MLQMQAKKIFLSHLIGAPSLCSVSLSWLVANYKRDILCMSFNDGFFYCHFSIKAIFTNCKTNSCVNRLPHQSLCSSSRVTMGLLAASLINVFLPQPVSFGYFFPQTCLLCSLLFMMLCVH
ncbi:hypothetical protein XENORESO_006663 [Xenotaenia resolanae]|uniref:Secreted protein n=1 Tax=Xenotaenia resolanae TaxID=208358 RepID=A0ABV0X0E0_9TELE